MLFYFTVRQVILLFPLLQPRTQMNASNVYVTDCLSFFFFFTAVDLFLSLSLEPRYFFVSLSLTVVYKCASYHSDMLLQHTNLTSI